MDAGGIDTMTMMFIGIDVAVGILIVACAALVILRYRKKNLKN